MQFPKVSILMPYKNTADFLPECIESIIDQKYPCWELCAIDDHSTDHSTEIINSYSNNNITIFKNEGKGIIDALRTAFKHSKGAFITRMDSDDIMASEKLLSMAKDLQKYGPGYIALGKVKYFSENGISDGYKRYEIWLNSLTIHGNNFSEIYKECVIPSPCWMLHREDLEICGSFNHNRYPEDYDLTFRLYANKLKCIPNNEILHYWRDYDTRTSRTSEHYAQNYFLDIKLYYFLKLHYNSSKALTVWGAGNKGKAIAKMLVSKNVNFHWICDNPKKIGRTIYGKKLVHYNELERLKNPQSIITVANAEAQAMIHHYLIVLGQSHMADYYFFC